ncbi:related to SLX1-subunit of a complex involved in DNA-dependent DNA replication [Sporisorium scitamineum]|uniref:Related to SLX1-subunit of a complex involved in DNA-dependent DNA replication n=1 Tax=Sporisorium scitamineum TaxID=49012 RepID=A0A0F7S058_9BASI|nr:hypothetical protein [Sporisorium scitamineum]CDS82298.1 related to SLX1-subunit of a complex involved in DNA-dependent DNA replication [Sporisorium scitamineum]
MSSSVTKHTIPPFYACYFLRSLSSPGITYIGSTPAPPRRKRQHNGDLTQGAYKTARARPWEMECIVYGFSSKIAALQFEWAWAKPHLSRHLKFLSQEHSVGVAATDTSAWAGMALFPSTSMTPGQIRWGKPKRRIARPPSTPNARLLAMRALLRSEPFCGWGLKLAFFTEWSWLAYQRLEAASTSTSQTAPSTTHWRRYSRSGKPLHPLYPVTVCDFAGVDGKRTPLVHVLPQHRLDAGVADQPVKKRQTTSRKKADAEETPQWPETLPRTANLKGLDARVQDFAAFPSPRPAAQSTDLTKKVKRTRKSTNEAAVGEEEEAENELDAEEADLDAADAAAPVAAEPGSASTRVLHRLRFDDLDLEESEWKRLEKAIAANSGSREPIQAMSDFMQTCVQRHIAAQDTRTADSAVAAPTSPCALCHGSIDLSRQLDFVLCPSPHTSTSPDISSASSSTTDPTHSNRNGECDCTSIFHFSCLAQSFLEQQSSVSGANGSSTSTVLPTHGACPIHTDEQKQEALWADVVRAMYRRYERFERLLQFLVRSSRSYVEHLNPPPEVEATSKASKTKRRANAAPVAPVADESSVGIEGGEADAARMAEKITRKRRQPAVTNVDAEEPIPLAFDKSRKEDVSGKTDTRRKVSRRAKVTQSSDVIDLT